MCFLSSSFTLRDVFWELWARTWWGCRTCGTRRSAASSAPSCSGPEVKDLVYDVFNPDLEELNFKMTQARTLKPNLSQDCLNIGLRLHPQLFDIKMKCKFSLCAHRFFCLLRFMMSFAVMPEVLLVLEELVALLALEGVVVLVALLVSLSRQHNIHRK